MCIILFQTYVQNLTRPIYQTVAELLQSENKTHIDKLFIRDVLLFACYINLNECETDMVAKFNNWLLQVSSNK